MLSFAQNCNDFLTVQRSGINYPWKYDIQSKSANFFAGKNSKLNIICNEGKDYKISFLVSSSIMNDVTIKVTDNSGKVYFFTGVDETLNKELEAKKQMLVSLENQKAKIKIGKKKVEIDADINKLKVQISNSQYDIDAKQYSPSSCFEFTAASTMELIISVSATDKCSGKGCVGVLVSNKPTEKSGF
jgi:hypothetical protein